LLFLSKTESKAPENKKRRVLLWNRDTGDVREKAPVNRVVVFTITALSLLMTTVDMTIVATALETLQKELHTTVSWVGWTITAYSLGFALMLPLSAKFSTRFGHRRIFLASIIIFTVSSLACGLVSNIYALIPLRVIQALGAGGITPSVTAIIVNHFGSARDRAVGLFGSIFPIGAVLGPVFGGFFVTYWSWRGIFFVNVPIGLAVVFLSLHFIPKDIVPRHRLKVAMDPGGLFWLGLGILASMFAATFISYKDAKILSVGFIGLALAGLTGLIGFFFHINRARHPFIKPLYAYGKGFGSVNLLNLTYGGVTSGVLSLVPLYVAERYGIDALHASILLIAQGAASIIFSTLMAIFIRRTGYRTPLLIGCTIITVGVALIALPPYFDLSPFWWMTGATFLIGVGTGSIDPPARNAGLNLVPEESATLAALRSQCFQIGEIITVGIATAIASEKIHPGITLGWVYAAIALGFLLGLPIIKSIPEHKGAW
jgi:EmrB/QacA subfamily drug resistance transporter